MAVIRYANRHSGYWNTYINSYNLSNLRMVKAIQEKKMISDILIDRELQACPFCGSADIKVKGYPHTVTYHGQKHWFIVCNECGGQTKRHYADVNKAIDAWNRRVEK